MASKSILKTFWPVLKVLQLLGACPIQKDEDSTFGFKAFTFRVYLTIVLFTWLVLAFGIYIGVFAYLYYIDGISIFDVNDYIFNFSGLSEMDKGLMFGMSAAIMIVNILILIGNFTLKNQFIELMQLFASLSRPQQNQGRIYFLMSLILSWILSQFGVIATCFSTDSVLKTKVLVTIAVLSSSIIQSSQLIGKAVEGLCTGFETFYHSRSQQRTDQRVLVFTLKFLALKKLVFPS